MVRSLLIGLISMTIYVAVTAGATAATQFMFVMSLGTIPLVAAAE